MGADARNPFFAPPEKSAGLVRDREPRLLNPRVGNRFPVAWSYSLRLAYPASWPSILVSEQRLVDETGD
jgi:hypothetical protein